MIFNVQTTANKNFHSSGTTGHFFQDDAWGFNCKTPVINRSHAAKSPHTKPKISPYISLWYHS